VTLKVVLDDAGTRAVALHGRLDMESLIAFAATAAELTVGMRCDLTQLKSADEAGLELLTRLSDRGIELVGASPYIELRLDGVRARLPK
jgi:ABC-type transporter Mla MlaB component